MIVDILAGRGNVNPLFVDRKGVATASDVLRCAEGLGTAFAALDLAPSPRVGVVMPNDRTLACVILASLIECACAPMNPRLSEAEFIEAFEDLDLDAVIVGAGTDPAVQRAASRCGVSILHVDAGGLIDHVSAGHRRGDHGEGHSLLLRTSGTTAQPKLVGLSASNLMSSAQAVATSLQLEAEDRALCVMPLFHIHGIVGMLVSSVFSGGSVDVRPGFDPADVRRGLLDPHVTWMSAAPSMYAALMLHPERIRTNGRFRVVRSSSAALPDSVWNDAESVLGCPLLNAYGMTEASHQMASNPLPPHRRIVGTVGPGAGAQVAVLVDGHLTTAADVRGEIVVKGPGVMARYISPASANDHAWHDGWLRTGDTGCLDESGYLTLHGRIKEIINVAGEKVSPFEVEAAMLLHPDVTDAVAFAVPDRLRGERVAAAVVLRTGCSGLDEAALRRFIGDRMVNFKVPRRIVALDRIPLGPTGKVQRMALAHVLAKELSDG